MAIQVIPIIKALSSVIATTGDMLAMWQTIRRQAAARPEPDGQPAAGAAATMAAALQESCAQNSRLIAEVAEQLRKLALDLQAQEARIDRRLKMARAWSLAAIGLGIAALGAAGYAVHFVT